MRPRSSHAILICKNIYSYYLSLLSGDVLATSYAFLIFLIFLRAVREGGREGGEREDRNIRIL